MKSVFSGSESENAYQALCENFKLIFGFEVLLFKDTYEN